MMDRVERGETLSSGLPLSRLSFRSQITVLGTLVFVLFLAVLLSAFATLRYTKSAVLSGEKKQLVGATQSLAREYEDKAQSWRQNNELPPLSSPTTNSSREYLALFSKVVLQSIEGVSGGFYSKSNGTLQGYSPVDYDGFPEMGGSSEAKRGIVLSIAREAADTNQPAERVLSNGPGIMLIEALPVRDGYNVVGSAWTAKHLAGLPGSNRFRAYLITAALGMAALASVLLTLLVIRNLQGGVRKIEGGLRGLERNLGSQIDTSNDPQEIQHIVQAINRLGATLKEKIEREKQIESQLRHAERLASLGRLVAGVAHEVRNPLATIRLRVQMCRREAQDSKVKDSCSVALEEIERLNGMVNRLLNFGRPVQLRLEPTDLRTLVEERMESFREGAAKSGISFEANLPRESVSLPVDKDRIAQVFDNVIQNAIEAMSDRGGTLTITVARPTQTPRNGTAAYVEFRDNGKGMSSSVASHVFDPFFTTKPSGTGLGLSICHELVQAHGGDIRLESGEGRGTSVRILIPTCQT